MFHVWGYPQAFTDLAKNTVTWPIWAVTAFYFWSGMGKKKLYKENKYILKIHNP